MTTLTLEKKAEDTTNQQELQGVPQQHGQLMKVSTTTYVNSLTTAAMSMKYALGMELATSLAVFAEHNGTSRSARRFLMGLYALAGYDVEISEYKTVARRCLAASLLYDKLGGDKVMEMIGGAAEGMAITNLASALETLKLRSYDAVFAYCGRVRLPAKAASSAVQGTLQGVTTAPQATGVLQAAPQQPIVSGTEKEPDKTPVAVAEGAQVPLEEGEIVLDKPVAAGATEAEEEETPRYMRRASDIAEKAAASVAANHTSVNPYEGWLTVGTEHCVVVIAKEATRLEVLEAAMQLVSIAEQMEHKAIEEKAVRETVMAAKLKEELKKVAVGKSIKIDEVGGLEPMKPKGRRVVR